VSTQEKAGAGFVRMEPLHRNGLRPCCQYAHRNANDLRGEAHDWLREIGGILRQPVGLKQHQEIDRNARGAGWLALLIGCIERLDMRSRAEATRTAAAQFGAEAGSAEIVGWTHEVSAWFALTQGRYESILSATSSGLAIAGRECVAATKDECKQATGSVEGPPDVDQCGLTSTNDARSPCSSAALLSD
jgi:hypothetical protein